MPFRHVVMFEFADHVPDDYADQVRAALDALPPQISEIRSYVHGDDAGLADGNWDYVLVADFDSADDYVTYRDHPIHQQMIADTIVGNLANRSAVQFHYGD
jgi:hypothetical protein